MKKVSDTLFNETSLQETTFQDDRIVRSIKTRSGISITSIPSGDGESEAEAEAADAWWRGYLAGHKPVPEVPPTRTINSVELFCGPGGLAQGFSQAVSELGMTFKSLVAIDEDAGAVEVYKANHHPAQTSTESISMIVDYQIRGNRDSAEFVYEPEMIGEEWESLIGTVDVVLAGPPCQGHSNLNNKSRRNDPRNELYLTVPAVAVALKSKSVVIENVPTVIHDSLGVVESTKSLLVNAGYKISGGILHADRMGWPQHRSRYFLIATLEGDPIPVEEIEIQLRAPARDIMWCIGDLADSTDDHFLTSRPELSRENVDRIDYLFENDAYDLDLSQRPDCHKNGTSYMSVYGRLYPDRPSPTITTGFMTPGRGRYVHPTRRRTITAWEAARIQGFPDTYDFGPDGENPPTRSQLSKWIGDAVPMPLGYAAAMSIYA